MVRQCAIMLLTVPIVRLSIMLLTRHLMTTCHALCGNHVTVTPCQAPVTLFGDGFGDAFGDAFVSEIPDTFAKSSHVTLFGDGFGDAFGDAFVASPKASPKSVSKSVSKTVSKKRYVTFTVYACQERSTHAALAQEALCCTSGRGGYARKQSARAGRWLHGSHV